MIGADLAINSERGKRDDHFGESSIELIIKQVMSSQDKQIQVAIADDHTLLRKAFARPVGSLRNILFCLKLIR